MKRRLFALTSASLSLAAASACSTNTKSAGDTTPPADGSQPAAVAYAVAADVKGLPATQEVHGTSVNLTFALSGQDKDNANLKITGFECRSAPNATWAPCLGSPYPITGLKDGMSVDLAVRAVLVDQVSGQTFDSPETDVHFKVVLNSTPKAISDLLQVGSGYQLTVPAGMHVTEYSTSKTTGVLSEFRISNDSDPNYLGNYTCNHDWDRIITSASPAGETLSYCHSTPTRDAYKDQNEYRLANNHVEIATDTTQVAKDNAETLSVSVFDADYELMASHSRFASICGTKELHKLAVPMLPNFFLTAPAQAVDFFVCDAYLPDNSGQTQQWRVGAFYNIQSLDFTCGACEYENGVEMVYMSRVNADNHLDANFAKIAQTRLLSVLSKLTP